MDNIVNIYIGIIRKRSMNLSKVFFSAFSNDLQEFIFLINLPKSNNLKINLPS